MTIHETLKALRVAHGYAQEQLAEKLDISRQAIAKWESGATLPELDRLIQLAALYQTTLDALVCGQQPCATQTARTATPQPDTAALIAFLLRASEKTYAGKGPHAPVPSRLQAHDLHFAEGEYRYIDSYIGGARFVGEELLYRRDVCVWGMNYCGRTLGEGFSGDFLKAALLKRPPEMPFRGPRLYRDGRFSYHNDAAGDFGWFSGREDIYCDQRHVYTLRYHGGWVET